MTFSTLVVTDINSVVRTVTFRADERYSLNWGLIETEETARPNAETAEPEAGKALLLSAGMSITSIDISGSFISISGGDSADRQLFNDLHLLAKDSMGLRQSGAGVQPYIKATLTLILNDSPASQVVLEGWIMDFIADRDAVEGLVEVKISFRFLIEDDPDISGLV